MKFDSIAGGVIIKSSLKYEDWTENQNTVVCASTQSTLLKLVSKIADRDNCRSNTSVTKKLKQLFNVS